MVDENQIVQLPISFYVAGNIIPALIAALNDTTPFTANHATLSILTATLINGVSMKRLQVSASW